MGRFRVRGQADTNKDIQVGGLWRKSDRKGLSVVRGETPPRLSRVEVKDPTFHQEQHTKTIILVRISTKRE